MYIRPKRLLLHPAVAFLAFVVGVGVSYAWLHYGPIVVVSTTYACGPKATSSHLRLLGGERVSNRCRRYSSPNEATEALKTETRGARILEHTAKIDSEGHRVEELIVSRDSRFFNFNTHENFLCSTEGPTLRHLRWANNR